MGEPERRRRRLRPSSTPAPEPAPDDIADQPPPAASPPAASPPAAPSATPVPGPTMAAPAPAPAAPTPAVPNPAMPNPAAPNPAVPTPAAPTVAATAPVVAAAPTGARQGRVGGERPTGGSGNSAEDREAERGLRGLVGSGSSQVSVGAALRARDATRPTEAHLAEAEARLVIVRRNWSPREDLPRR